MLLNLTFESSTNVVHSEFPVAITLLAVFCVVIVFLLSIFLLIYLINFYIYNISHMYYLVNTMLYIGLIGLVSTEMCWLVDMDRYGRVGVERGRERRAGDG